jgi:hypothetical protein
MDLAQVRIIHYNKIQTKVNPVRNKKELQFLIDIVTLSYPLNNLRFQSLNHQITQSPNHQIFCLLGGTRTHDPLIKR